MAPWQYQALVTLAVFFTGYFFGYITGRTH